MLKCCSAHLSLLWSDPAMNLPQDICASITRNGRALFVSCLSIALSYLSKWIESDSLLYWRAKYSYTTSAIWNCYIQLIRSQIPKVVVKCFKRKSSTLIVNLAICALSPSSENCYLACQPLRASDYYTTSSSSSSSNSFSTYNGIGDIEIYDANAMKLANIVQAHKSTISCISMNSEGTLLATASEKVGIRLGSALLLCWRARIGYSHSCLCNSQCRQGVSVPKRFLLGQDLLHVF